MSLSFKGLRFPAGKIRQAVRLQFGFTFSLRDVKWLLPQRVNNLSSLSSRSC